MKNILQILLEAEEQRPPTQEEINEWRTKVMQAKKTGIPKPISAVKAHLWNTGEYELYEFLENCEWWEVGNKDAPHWYRTAAVRMGPSKIEFYYDPDFMQRLAKNPKELIFLIAHEASHILRFHIDRSEAAGHDGDRANTAQDMIINDDILRTDKVAGWQPELIKNSTIHGEDAEEPDKPAVLQIPDKFREDFKDVGRKAYYYENMYNWLVANEKKQDQDQGEGQEKNYFEEGSIVKVNETGEYRKITKVNSDGTYETEPVDIDAEIDKVKKGSGAGGGVKAD